MRILYYDPLAQEDESTCAFTQPVNLDTCWRW
jgi:hypothetical protein